MAEITVINLEQSESEVSTSGEHIIRATFQAPQSDVQAGVAGTLNLTADVFTVPPELYAIRDQILNGNDALQDAIDLARDFANAPLNEEVEPGLFSAYHYAQKTENMLHAANSIYLATDGNDMNSGKTPGSAFRTFEAALAKLRKLAKGGQLCALKVYPGSYSEKGNLEIPENAAVVSEAGQFVTELVAAPGYEQTNMFLVNSGSYLQGFSFRNQQIDSFEDPTVGFAVAFAPGANIKRSPYIRDSSQLSNYTPQNIAAPLDAENANPEVGKGGGMLLADRAVLNPNSIFPYMLAFGATPRTPNGMGYVSKNGAGINGISSLTIFSRVSFYALNGGQITLNNSGTQFGDISMYAKGSMNVVEPARIESGLTANAAAADLIRGERLRLINAMWDHLVTTGQATPWLGQGSRMKRAQRVTTGNLTIHRTPYAPIDAASTDMINGLWEYLESTAQANPFIGSGYRKKKALPSAGPVAKHPSVLSAIDTAVPTIIDDLWTHLTTNYNTDNPGAAVDWTTDPNVETLTRRDAGWLISAILRDLRVGADNSTRGFVEGLYDLNGDPVFAESFRVSLPYSWDFLKQAIKDVTPTSTDHYAMLDGLFDILTDVLNNEADRDQTRVVVPEDLATYPMANSAVEGLILANADLVSFPTDRTDTLINDMWAYLIANDDPYAEGSSGVEWDGNTTLENFTKRDAQWLLTALARDMRHGVTQSTRRFAEGLFTRNGDYVFEPRMKRGLMLCWDYLVSEFESQLNPDSFAEIQALVGLVKDTVETPTYGWSSYEQFTRRDAGLLISAIMRDLLTGADNTTRGFVEGLYDLNGVQVFDEAMRPSILASWTWLKQAIKDATPGYFDHFDMVDDLFAVLTDVLNNETARDDTKVVVPADLSTPPTKSYAAEKVLVDNAPIDLAVPGNQTTVISDMWNYLIANEPETHWSGVAWESDPTFEAFTKRDASWFLTALARDFRHGNTMSSRRFIEGLFNRNGEYVFDPRMKPGIKMCWDYLKDTLAPQLSTRDQQTLANLVALMKTNLDYPEYGFSPQEQFTRRDGSNFIKAVANDVQGGSDDSTVGLALGFFDYKADYVFDPALLDEFVSAWEWFRTELLALIPGDVAYDGVTDSINLLIDTIRDTVETPTLLQFNSLIESLGHQFNNAGAGVNKNALPLNFRRGGQNRTVPFTVIEENGGRVRWSGSDELNNQYLAGGTRINGLTGRIEGRPFDTAVRQIARRIANTRSNF